MTEMSKKTMTRTKTVMTKELREREGERGEGSVEGIGEEKEVEREVGGEYKEEKMMKTEERKRSNRR